MTQKSELLRIAAELKSTADRLIDCAKEDDKEESDEGEKESKSKDTAFLAAAVKSKMDKYK